MVDRSPRGHSGFAALIGRPNAGKSTLLNRLVGEKLAIVSPKPQTTRRKILGIVNRPEGQIAFVDTPGIHRAQGQLNRYMVDAALHASRDVDVNLFLLEASEDPPVVNDANRFILDALKRANKPTFLVINKVDAVPKPVLLPLIDLYQHQFSFTEVVPISARTGDGVEPLLSALFTVLPKGEPMFDPEVLTDQAERDLVAEYIREQVLKHCRQEIPYSAAVVVEYFDETERQPRGKKPSPSGLAGLIRIEASLFVERESQKAIVIGKSGQMLKTIGTDARKTIERFLGTHVFLSLRVRVEPDWSESPKALKKLGYE